MAAKGKYIYGIVPNFYGTEMFGSLENSGVYAIPYQNISAIVSDRASAQLDYSDRESLGYLLINHQRTIEYLMGKGFTMIMPMRLGTIARTKDEVFKILSNGYDLIVEALSKIEHLTEYDIAVTWADFSAALVEIAEHPDIIALKAEMQSKADTHLKIDQVKVGMMVQSKLKERNSKVELTILEALSSISIDIKTHEVMNDEMITNSAFLINRNKKELFEEAIDKLDEKYNGLLNFKLVGPLPCYSFFTLEVKDLNADRIVQSGQDLGLSEETTESEIKRAYLEKARLYHPDNTEDNGDPVRFNLIQNSYLNLVDYSLAVKQSSKDEQISLRMEKVVENLILVKIKE
jgi:hypothetical protein